jgi:hypothetical protein
VVLADGVELDILQDHHLVVALLEAGRKLRRRVLTEAREKLGVQLGDAPGRLP